MRVKKVSKNINPIFRKIFCAIHGTMRTNDEIGRIRWHCQRESFVGHETEL